MFAVPSFFHQFYNCLRLIANVMVSASVVQMLSSSNMIFIALLTVFFLKKKYFRHHLLSILLIVLGMSFVSLSFVLSNDSGSSDHSTTDMVIGLICQQLGELIGALGYVIEEKFFGQQEDLDPLLIVGFEGIAGILFWVIALPIMQSVTCDVKALCAFGRIEDTVRVFEDYAANPTLIVQSVVLIFVSCIVNSTGVGITKYGSAAQRTTIGLAKNMLVWIVFMCIPIARLDKSKDPPEWKYVVLETFSFL